MLKLKNLTNRIGQKFKCSLSQRSVILYMCFRAEAIPDILPAEDADKIEEPRYYAQALVYNKVVGAVELQDVFDFQLEEQT